jgi:hypothetical protein
LFHEVLDGDGNVTQSGRLFYFEEWGVYGLQPPDYSFLFWIALLGIPAAVVAVVLLRAWRRPKGKNGEDRSP